MQPTQRRVSFHRTQADSSSCCTTANAPPSAHPLSAKQVFCKWKRPRSHHFRTASSAYTEENDKLRLAGKYRFTEMYLRSCQETWRSHLKKHHRCRLIKALTGPQASSTKNTESMKAFNCTPLKF